MAHKQPRPAKVEKVLADVNIESSAVAQELERVQAEAFAKTAGVVIEAAEPVADTAETAETLVAESADTAETLVAESADVAELLAPMEPAVEAVATPEPLITETAEAVVTAADSAATTAKKEWTFMATQFEAPKMLSDVSDRAKASFEKTQKFAADFGDFSKGNVEAMVESSKIAAKGLETIGQDAAEYTRRSFEGMTATIKNLATVKSPTEFFKLQSDYIRSAFDSAVAQSSKNTETMIKLASDAAQPISNRFAVAVEKVKVAA